MAGDEAVKRTIAALALLVAVSGCTAERKIVEVKVPVQVRAVPPAELMTPVPAPDGAVFVAPCDPRSASNDDPCNVIAGIAKDGSRKLQELVNELRARLSAWQSWATEQ